MGDRMSTTTSTAEIQVVVDANGVEAGLRQASTAAERAERQITNGANNSARSQSNLIQAIQRTSAQMEAGGRTSARYYEIMARQRGIDPAVLEPYLRQLRAVEQAQQRAADSANGAASTIRGAFTSMLAGLSVAALGQQVVSTQREFDKLNASLITATGSAEGATAAFSALQVFAATTPFGLAESTEAFIKMRNLGLDPSERALRSYGNTAAAMGKSLEQMVEAVADASTGEFERLKEFGIKASQNGEKVTLTFKGISTTVKNEASAIEQYLMKLGTVDFAGAMEERAKTLDGAISNLGDSWNSFLLRFSQDGFNEVAERAVRSLASALDTLGNSIGAISGGLMTAAKIATGYVAIFVAAPAIYAAATAALWPLIAATATYAMNVAIGQANTLGLNTALFGTSVAAQLAAGSLTKAALAGNVLFAAFAGWQIGKYLEEQFVEVKIFAEVLTGAVLEAWEHIKLGSKLALDAMTVMWRTTFSGLTASLAPVYEAIAAGLSKMGFSEKAGQIQDFANRVRAAGESQGTFASRTAEARAEHERNIKAIRQVTDSHVAAIMVADQVSAATRGVAAATAAATGEKKEMSKEYKKAFEAANSFIDGQERELEAIGKTVAEVRLLNAARAAAEAPEKKQRDRILELAAAINKQSKAWQDSEAARKAVEDVIGANAETMLQLQERARGLEREIELHGKTAEAAVMAEAAKVRATAGSMAISEEYRAQLVAQAEQLERIAGLQGRKDAMDASSKAAKQAADDWKRASEEINRSLTDALLRGFESGKSFGRNLVDTLKNMFSTLVLRPVISAAVSPLAAGLTGSLGLAGAANAATGVTSGSGPVGALAGLAGSASNLYGMVTGGATLAGGLGTGFLGSLAGGLNGAGIGSGLTSALGMNIGNSIASVVGPNVASGIASGLSGLAAAAPWVAGALAVYTIGKKAFGRGPKEFTGEQTLNGSLGAGGFMGTLDAEWVKKGGWFRSDKNGVDRNTVGAEMSAGLTSAYDAIKASSADFARVLGINADSIATRTQAISIAMGKDEAANQKAIADFFVGVGNTIAGELLPEIGKFQAQGEAASATLQRLAAGYSTIEQALLSIGMSFGAVGTASLEARERLLAAAGGIEAFAANTAGFQQNFLSEAERNAPVLKMVTEQMAALGLASVDTRDEFKAVVLGLDLTTEAGAKQYGALMNLQAAFAQVYPAIDKAAIAAQVLQQRASLQEELDQLTMTSAQLLAKQRDALDESNRPLFDQIQALKESRAALEAQAEAQRNATQAIKEQATSLLSGVDSAFGVLQRVVGREKQLLQERITTEQAIVAKHQALSSALRSTLDGMSVPGQELFGRQSAQAQIQAALAMAKASGSLPDADGLKRALSVVGQDASALFATQQDYLRDFYTTQNDIAALADITDSTLSIEEKSLKLLEEEGKRLDSILTSAQQQLDVLKGIDTSVLSVADAIAALGLSIASAKGNAVVASAGAVNAQYQSVLGRAPDAAGMQFWQDQAAKGVSQTDILNAIANSAEANIKSMYQATLGRAADAGGLQFWVDQVNKGTSYADIQKALEQSGEKLRGFAVGTNYVPTNMPAMIHEGERIIPAADNRELMRRLSTPSDNSAVLAAELRALREENAGMRKDLNAALYAIAKNTMQTADHLDAAVNGDVPLATKVIPA